MKIYSINSYMMKRRNQGDRPVTEIMLECENDAERAIMRMAMSGNREVDIYGSTGNASIRITMPRGK